MARTEMAMQPLWIDASKWQGQINYQALASIEGYDKVYGIISRAGWGENGGYIDPYFARNWEKSAQFYRASYWAYWDYFPMMHQLDLWYQANPTIDFISRMWDLEKENAPSEFLSEQSWLASEKVLERDGHRFIIYSRYDILERTLCKYWTHEQLNQHKYMLAQYDISTPQNPSESNGIVVPTNIDPENILWKQTSPHYPLYQGSGPIDRDRWIWTDVATMHEQLVEIWGSGHTEPEPPVVIPPVEPDCCAELGAELEVVKSKVVALRTDVDSVEVVSNDNHVRLGTTRSDLSDLQDKVAAQETKLVQLERAIGEQATSIGKLTKAAEDLSIEFGKLVISINGIKDEINKINTKLTVWQFIKKIFSPNDGNNM